MKLTQAEFDARMRIEEIKLRKQELALRAAELAKAPAAPVSSPEVVPVQPNGNLASMAALIRGEAGPIGPQGPQGEVGPQGERGIPGERGTDGASGPQGQRGPTGPNGLDGLDGRDGIDGADGIQGPQGEPGEPGLVWKGNYSQGAHYDVGDAVAFEGSSFIARFSTSARPSPVGGDWDLLARKGDDGHSLVSSSYGPNEAEAITVTAPLSGTVQSVLEELSTVPAAPTSTADLPDSTDKRYVTDAQRTVLSNTSGSNSGDVTIDTANGLSLSGQMLSMSAAGAAQAGAVTTSTQTFAGAKTFSGAISASNLSGTNTGDQTSVSGNAGTATALQTARTINGVSFDGTANISTPTISNTNGTGSTDVVVKVGTSVADGSVHGSAKVFRVVTGLGGTEVELVKVSRATAVNAGIVTIDSGARANVRHLVLANCGGGYGGILQQFAAGGSFSYGTLAGASAYIDSSNRAMMFEANGNAYDSAAAGFTFVVSGSNPAGSRGVVDFKGEALGTQTAPLARFFSTTTQVASVGPTGQFSQYGSDSSASPGAATINKPIGKSAVASGATSVVITNSLVAAGDHVIVTWHGDLGALVIRTWVTTAAGSFTVNLSGAAGSDTAFCWEVKKRL